MTPRDRERHYVASLLSDRDAAKEVRAFGLAPYLRGRYERLYDERLAELRRVTRRQLLYTLCANVVIGAVLAGTLVLVARLTLSERISPSEAAVTVAGIALASGRLTSAGFAAGALAEAALYVDDYREFLGLLPEAERRRPTAPAPAGFRRLEVDNVTFAYPTGTEPALLDVSLEVRAGEVVALVGENGSGKTTLAKLLARLYTPGAGTIRWDGTDVASVDPDALRLGVAVIFQDFLRFHLPARDNVGLGRHEAMADLERIVEAAARADADAFCASCDRDTTRCSARSSSAARTSRSGSGSALRSPERSSGMPPSSFSTNRQLRLTRAPSTSCSSGCARCCPDARFCSSPIDSRASARPTASTCSSPAASSRKAPTMN
jgi:ATP-binding cassette subfamily B protein